MRATADATAAARAAAAAGGAAAERARAAQERLASLERAAAARAEERLEALRRERQALEAELADAAGGREGASRRSTARDGAGADRDARGVGLARCVSASGSSWPSPTRCRRPARPRPSSKRRPTMQRCGPRRCTRARRLAERAALATERLAALERSLAEREGIAPAARLLADEGAELALSLLDVAPGEERAVAAALGWGASAVVAEDAAAGLALLRRASDAGLGSLAVLVGRRPAERVAELPVVPLDELLAATVPVRDCRGLRLRPAARRALVRG